MSRKNYKTDEERKNAEKLRKKLWAANNKEKVKQSKQKYNKKNKEKLIVAGKKYRENNKDKEALRHKKYLEENKAKRLETTKKYRENNKEIINYKARLNKSVRNKNHKKRYASDDLYKITCNLRSLIKNSFKRKGYDKKTRTNKILGCSYEELKRYIESKFEPWMTWDNHGKYNGDEKNYGWDIDHIIPISSAKTEDDVIKLNHYTNLQPLCSYINIVIKLDN